MAVQIASLSNLRSGKSERYTAEQVIAALRAARGLASVAARTLGCSRQTVQNYIERHPTVRAAQHDAREEIIDLAEGRFYEAINRGESWAVMAALRTIGKDRGYTERTETTGKDGGPVVIRVEYGRNREPS